MAMVTNSHFLHRRLLALYREYLLWRLKLVPDFSCPPLWTQVEASYLRCLVWAVTHHVTQAKVTLVVWLSLLVYCFQQFLLCTPCQLGINSQEAQISLEPTIPLSQVTLCIKWQHRKVQSQIFTMKGRQLVQRVTQNHNTVALLRKTNATSSN